MAAADDMVVHDPAEPLRRALAVDAVLEVHERGEDGGIGHLAGGHARFDLRRAEELLHLLNEQCLNLADEVCALIIEDLRVIERLLLFMLGIAVRRIGGRKRRTARDCVFSDGMRLMHRCCRQRWFSCAFFRSAAAFSAYGASQCGAAGAG